MTNGNSPSCGPYPWVIYYGIFDCLRWITVYEPFPPTTLVSVKTSDYSIQLVAAIGLTVAVFHVTQSVVSVRNIANRGTWTTRGRLYSMASSLSFLPHHVNGLSASFFPCCFLAHVSLHYFVSSLYFISSSSLYYAAYKSRFRCSSFADECLVVLIWLIGRGLYRFSSVSAKHSDTFQHNLCTIDKRSRILIGDS